MNLIEHLRVKVIEDCFKTRSFSNAWKVWGPLIQNQLGSVDDWNQLFDLGDNLSSVFMSTRGDIQEGLSVAEANSKASTSGTAWECLVTWYLNLIFLNSNAVVFKKTGDVPKPLTESLKVLHKNHVTNSESDLLVVIFPDIEHFNTELLRVPLTDSRGIPFVAENKRPQPFIVNGKIQYNRINKYIDKISEYKFNEFELGVIQCKTNWNENTQIPMLWDIVYRLSNNVDQDIPNFKVGASGFRIDQLKRFSYSFVTVPTNKLENYKATSLSVNRVRNLTGGNYWGHKRKDSVANSLKEIFSNNFMTAFSNNLRQTVQSTIEHDPGKYEVFRIYV